MACPLISPTPLKADEEVRNTDHAQLVEVTENEEVATLTAKIETNLQQGVRGGRHEGRFFRDGDGQQRDVIGVGGGAPEEQSPRTQEQIVAEEVISAVDEEGFCG